MVARAIITPPNPQSPFRNSLSRRLHVEALEDRRMLAVITVNSPLDNFDPASPTTDGLVTLREAILAANADAAVGDAPAGSDADVIEFDFGHDGPETILLTHGEILITNDVTINGPGAELLTVDASGNDTTPENNFSGGTRVLDIDADQVSIAGLTLTGGDADYYGGGIHSRGNVTLTGVNVQNNTAGHPHALDISAFGGGIYHRDGSLTVIDSTISGNIADGYTNSNGGGIYARDADVTIHSSTIIGNTTSATYDSGGGIDVRGSLTVVGSIITGNSANYGGGISGGSVTVIDSTIRGNEASFYGGGIQAGNLTLIRSTISGNSSTFRGGGISSVRDVHLINTTISGNAAYEGGGVFSEFGPLTVTGSTISGNLAERGGGIISSNATLTNSIVAKNNANGPRGPDLTGNESQPNTIAINYTLIGDTRGSGITDESGIGNLLNVDPLLGPLDDNGGPTHTHALLPGSPAIDTGDPSIAFDEDEFDQRRQPFFRVANGNVATPTAIDMGAFELQESGPRLFIVDTLVDETDGDFSPGDFSLREAIGLANAHPSADIIEFDPALTAEGPATILLSPTFGELPITRAVTINGPGADLLTIDGGDQMDAPDRFRIFNVDDDSSTQYEVTIRGVTLTGGSSDFGGAIRNTEDLTIAESTITGNVGGYGGGIYSSNSRLMLSDSTISRNHAVYGGGIYTRESNVTVLGSRISENAADYGGGIRSREGNVTITNTTISQNAADPGYVGTTAGGISHFNGDVTVSGSTISENLVTGAEGSAGGGILVLYGNLTVIDSTISRNSTDRNSGRGGGIHFDGEQLSVIDSKILNNSTKGDFSEGGGIYCSARVATNITGSTIDGNSTAGYASPGGGISSGNVQITNSTISGNSTSTLSSHGGGIAAHGGQITGSTISGNTASSRYGGTNGGGVFVDGRQLSISNSTISSNAVLVTAYGSPTIAGIGGGIYDSTENSHITITNSIVANNRAGESPDLTGAESINYSLIGDTRESGITNESGIGNILNVDPLLGPLADNGGPTLTHALILGSPAIDTGDPSIEFDETEFDQRGEPFFRVQDGKSPPGRRIDMGAYERQEGEPRQFVVDTLADESDGDFAPGDFSLREAIESSNLNPGPDAILFDAALTDEGPATITLVLGELLITGPLSIEGPGADLLTIDAGGNDPTPGENNGDGSRVFHIDDGDDNSQVDVSISGLTLTGGDVAGQGGAIRSLENLAVSQSTITGNASFGEGAYGGAIFSQYGALTVAGSTIHENSTNGLLAGGAGIHSRDGDVSVSESTISHNVTFGLNSGGVGIFVIGGDLLVSDSQVTDNVSHEQRSSGGGIFADGGELVVMRSTIARNSTLGTHSKGAGIFADDNLMLVDSTVSDNHTEGFDGSGGGIQFFGSEAMILGSTISGNFTTGSDSPGGAISVRGGAPANLQITSSTITGNLALATDAAGGGIAAGSGDVVTLLHTILAGNDAVAGPDLHRVSAMVVVNYSLIGDTTGSGITGTTGTGNILNEDPHLGPLMDNGGPTATHALLPTSPAVDAGDPIAMAGENGVPEFDQRGASFGRVVDGDAPDDIAIDIGAYERQVNETFTFIVDTPRDESDGDYSTGDFSLREAIALANLNPRADRIQFDFGHDGPETILLTEGELLITDALTIDGFDADLLTIDAGHNSRIFNIDDPASPNDAFAVTLSGLTLTGGQTTSNNSSATDNTNSGGAIRSVITRTLTISESNLTDNSTAGNFAAGGAIIATGPLMLTDSLISGNSTTGDNAHGGGIEAAGNVTVTRSTIHDNHTHGSRSFGGGLYSAGDDATVRASTISANSTNGPDSVGGGLAGVNITLIDSTVHGNTTSGANSNGGGVWAFTASITQSTVSGNRASADGTLGGGVRTLGDAVISRSTITGNHATTGGGVYMNPAGPANLITGSIIAGNTADLYADLHPIVPNVVFYSLIGDTSDFSAEEFIVLNIGPGNLVDVDARLAPLADNGGPIKTHALLPESPAIDRGDPSIQFDENVFDQRGPGFLRVVDGNFFTDIVIDMGAYESQGIPTFAPGDYNEDGIVNAADYTMWRDGFGATYTEADYDVWKDHYGDEWMIVPNAGTGASVRSPAFLPAEHESGDAAEITFIPKSRASGSAAADRLLLATALVKARKHRDLPWETVAHHTDEDSDSDGVRDALFTRLGRLL